jgi:NAD+-dependent protein deacetylase SIR2
MLQVYILSLDVQLIVDLVFVIGTSLVVYPFAGLPEYTLPSVPRVLLNNDPVDDFDRPNDVSVLGDCDESVWSLCQKLGWDGELRELHQQIGGVDREWGGKVSKPDTKAEDTVDQLARELAAELKLDKEEDVELRKTEGRDETIARSDTWDDEAFVLKKDIKSKPEETEPPTSKKELADELKIDKDMEVKLRKAEEQVDNATQSGKSWDDDDPPLKDSKEKL